jgi:PhzF family phenazine biosynthesis protein
MASGVDLYVVDSFTETAFRGNPAAVVLMNSPADTTWMRAVAAEMKHSETAFVVVGPDDDKPKPLRWFTPTSEVDLCGHATLASAHVLGGNQRFETRSGVLTCTTTPDSQIEMEFPADQPAPAEQPPELATALPGITIEHIARGKFDVLVQASSETEVRALEPDLPALEQIAARGVIVTARGDRDGIDFVSRFFAPRAGIPEDPVTGSAHCLLAPWWSAALGRTDLLGKQLSERGGAVRAVLRGDSVALRGRAVTVLKGTLLV